MKCPKCDKIIDDNYNTCPYCGQQIKFYKKCANCGAELKENFKHCPNCGNSTTQTNQPTTVIIEEEKKGSCLGDFLKFILVVFVIIAILVIAYGISESCSKDNDKPSVSTTITKVEPTLSSESTLTGIKIYVKANDNYEEVNIKVNAKDSNGNIIKTFTLTGYNYSKGNTYTLSKDLSLSEMLSINSFSYALTYYR